MIRQFILNFLCLNIAVCFAIYSADEQKEAETLNEQQLIVRPVRPCELSNFHNFFQSELFWTTKRTLNPDIFKTLLQSYPKIPLGSFCITEIFNTVINSALSNEHVLDDLTKLSKEILQIYAIKNNSTPILNFNPIFFNDKNILHEALSSFLRIISTPDPNRAQGHEWKAQTFIRAFSHLWTALNGTEEDIEFNVVLRKSIATAVGLNPDFQCEDSFSNFYPNLANWAETCVKFHIPKRSGKPIATVLTFSLMHALTVKVRFFSDMPIAIQAIAPVTFKISGSWNEGSALAQNKGTCSPNFTTQKKPTLKEWLAEKEAEKRKTLTHTNSGRERRKSFDHTGKTIIPRSPPSVGLQAFSSTIPKLGPSPFDLRQNSKESVVDDIDS